MGFLNPQKTIDELEEQEERIDHQLSLAEKKALLAEAKKRYGRDWKIHLPEIKSGMDWEALKFKMN